MRRNGRVAAVVAGVMALAGAAAAGEQPLLPPPPVDAGGGLVVVSGGGGCVGGGCSAGGVLPPKTALHGLAIGAGCANPIGCGSPASEKTFVFGSCRQFYNPGNDCRGFLNCHGKCGAPLVYGPGGYGSGSPCEYGSYVNR